MYNRLKVSVWVRGGECVVGVQDPDVDPVISVVPGELQAVLSQVPALVARARERWRTAPRNPATKIVTVPLPPAPLPAAAVPKPPATPTMDRMF